MSVFSTLSDENKKELWACLALRHARGIGKRRARLLLEAYGDAYAAVEACLRSPGAWPERKLIPPDIARDFASELWREPASEEWKNLRSSDCPFLLWNAPEFPDLLQAIPDGPLLLYMSGDARLLRSPAVAVVGARDCTREGIAVAAYIARDLSKAGITVISGMAKGIDRSAHLAALEGPGKSVGVLGAGVDVPYPLCNLDLHAELAREGLLISELHPGAQPAAKHFPIRNRIISGLALGVLVVEAAERSGSLITARLALEQGREVFAVPGHTMAAVSGGCRELIRMGAKAAFTADDILVELAPQLREALRQKDESPSRQHGGERKSSPRKRSDALDTSLLDIAEAVLPQGKLPWTAPAAPSRRAKPRKPTGAGKSLEAPSAKDGSRAPAREAKNAEAPQQAGLNDAERRVISLLGETPVHIDSLCRRLDMDAGTLSAALTLLEVRGLVQRAPGMFYSLPASR